MNPDGYASLDSRLKALNVVFALYRACVVVFLRWLHRAYQEPRRGRAVSDGLDVPMALLANRRRGQAHPADRDRRSYTPPPRGPEERFQRAGTPATTRDDGTFPSYPG